jgi:Ca2+-binding EF-hand superfamily protein
LNIRNLTTALALACAAAVPAAYAQSGVDAKQAGNIDAWFEKYDDDRDGKLTAAEFELGKSYHSALDLDRDGYLTRDEAKQALAIRGKITNWKTMDADGDGYVTVREWTGTPEEFDAHDIDGDRVLSRYDRDLAREKSRAKARLTAYDQDKDGRVSAKEWPADEATFRQRDRNRDGLLDVEELQEDIKRKD